MDIYSLIKKKKSKPAYIDELFNSILMKCYKRIEYVSKRNNYKKIKDQNFIFFDIPDFVFGYPLFNKNDCSDFLCKELEKSNYRVCKYNNSLIISWQHIYDECENDKKNEEENIVEKINLNNNNNNNISKSSIVKKRDPNELLFNKKKFSLLDMD